ncbi:MAG TPA: tyrosine-type recombinase/integrase [Ktedonobacterales bacterium]|nr:tyrosine-type recombinase/integrase [Ktedonobacterales bacterium]
MRLDAALVELGFSKDWTPASRRWFTGRISTFIHWAAEQGVTEIEDVTAPLVRRYIDYRRTSPSKTGKPLSSWTLYGHVLAIKDLLNWAVREDLLDEKIVKRIERPKREKKVIAVFTPRQIDLLFAACDKGENQEQIVRDRAILAILIDTGIRANELCTLTRDRVYFADGDAWLLVDGKGRKQREVGLGNRARTLLHRYLFRHRQAPRDVSHVFVGRGDKPLTPEGLDRLLYRLRDRAGREHFQGVRVSAHTFRHNYAVSYLQNGGDVYKLSRLLGHSTVAVTDGYLKAFTARDARRGGSVLDKL